VKKIPVLSLPAAVFGAAFAVLIGATFWQLNKIDRTVRGNLSPGTKIEKQFAVLIPEMAHDLFYIRAFNGMKEAAERQNIALEVFEYPEGGADEIRRLLKLIANSEPAGAIVSFPAESAESESGAAEIFKLFAQKNIPLVTLEFDHPGAGREAFVGSNPFELGRLAGEAALEINPGGRAAVLLTQLPQAQAQANAAYMQGFREAVQGRVAIAQVRSYDNTMTAGEEFIREILVSESGVTLAVFTSSREAEGAAQALIQYGKVGTPLLIAADDNSEIRQLMELGVISATVVRASENSGRQAVEALAALSRKERVSAYVDPGSRILWPEDITKTRKP
jgi:ribose transport system substrate-binding protein